MIKKLTKTQKYVYIYLFILLFLLTSPFWLWQLKKEGELDVLIFNKTVPDQTYREHKGLVWILNNEKLLKDNGEAYSTQGDYRGFLPKDNNEYDTRSLPEDLNQYDVYYIADQYGVYEEEFYGSNELGERSNSLYGGLQEDEVLKIEEALLSNKGKTLIAEFNTFASPTSDLVREKVSNLLNLNWSGWIGRYFTDLNAKEVPIWVKENYQSQTGKWDFSGEGFIFVSKHDYIVVLEKSDLKGYGVEFEFTPKGVDFFGKEIKAQYQYWFDVVEARDGDEILANYHLPITSEAKIKLANHGIPSTFPAVIHHRNAAFSSYYFAGDFADEAEIPGIYQTEGIALWKEQFASRGSFFWKAYVPMMKALFERGLGDELKQQKIEIVESNGINYNSQTGSSYIQVFKDGKWEDLLVKGVNMGIAKPGYFPGETAITKAEYFRWFKQIGSMNANAVRIYTLHPPGFYEAFYQYNQIAEEPLYLFHGAWVNEEKLVESQDAFSEEVTKEFQSEMKQMIDIVHGNAEIPPKTGHASGEYNYNISPYVLGYMIGIEWDPGMVLSTNEKHKGKSQHSGKYFQSVDGSPFEIWLAEMMDYAAEYEVNQYNWQHTMSFTNWVTTDLLEHPAEPAEEEDMVSVNPNHIKQTDEFHAGLFASYHIYPYYPDFLNYEEKYINYADQQGEKNNYAGYLNDLLKEHNMPVIVAEFGVPSSRGMTHKNVYGMDQGFHSEQEQGEINKRLFQSIVSEGYGGGLVFTWQDEWFKRTWNTMDLDNPDRRPFWNNMQTNEQHFGLLSFEPGEFSPKILVDGDRHDWERQGIKPFHESEADSLLEKTFVTSDEGYLYMRFDYNDSVNLEEETTYLLFDTIDGQGQSSILLDNGNKIKTDFGVDFLANIGDKDQSRLLVDSYYDSFYYQYGHSLNMIPKASYASQKDNGQFHPIRYALNKSLTIPSTEEVIPFQSYETGKLLYGNGNPAHKDFNSLSDISISEDNKTIELRIPWLLLNVKDPSLREVMGDMWEKNGLNSSKTIEGIRLSVIVTDQHEVKGSFPLMNHDVIQVEHTKQYSWDQWDAPTYHERLKKSYDMMKDAYESISIKGDS